MINVYWKEEFEEIVFRFPVKLYFSYADILIFVKNVKITSKNQPPVQLSDLSVLEEVLRMVLEILNSSLTHQMSHNPQLLYTLLYKRHVFLPFATQPNFSDICMNIDIVLGYLMNKLEKTTSDPSVADVQVSLLLFLYLLVITLT